MAPKRKSNKLNGVHKSEVMIGKDAKKPNIHWSKGLVASMKDPDKIVYQDPLVTVIKDAYPKARHHYLVLPNEDISGISKLDKTHISLLRHMEATGKIVIGDIKQCLFKIGYHSVPSMQRLHLHVISDDMVSNCLKTKIHWNSFTTDFFIPSQDLIKMLINNGQVTKISDQKHKELMATPLQCHKCNLLVKNMPALKSHILTHA